MGTFIRAFPDAGIVALFVEAPGGGETQDINSLRNRPAKTPAEWLDYVFFHSDLDYMEISHYAAVALSHGSVSSGSLPDGVNGSGPFGWNSAIADHLLVTHNLGYEPFALVAFDGNILFPGMPVQTDGVGGARYACIYATTTELRMNEFASVGSATLAAADIDYTSMVFKSPPGPTASRLYEFNAVERRVQLGHEKFDTDRRYLQVTNDGDTPFGFSLGRTIDLSNGAPRFVMPDGSTFEPVPNDLTAHFNPVRVSGDGDVMAYGGAFTGDATIEVKVP